MRALSQSCPLSRPAGANSVEHKETAVTSTNPIGATRVIVGVDTHRDEHVAVAIDCLGGWLGQHRLPTAPRGYESLLGQGPEEQRSGIGRPIGPGEPRRTTRIGRLLLYSQDRLQGKA